MRTECSLLCPHHGSPNRSLQVLACGTCAVTLLHRQCNKQEPRCKHTATLHYIHETSSEPTALMQPRAWSSPAVQCGCLAGQAVQVASPCGVLHRRHISPGGGANHAEQRLWAAQQGAAQREAARAMRRARASDATRRPADSTPPSHPHIHPRNRTATRQTACNSSSPCPRREATSAPDSAPLVLPSIHPPTHPANRTQANRTAPAAHALGACQRVRAGRTPAFAPICLASHQANSTHLHCKP